MTSEAWVWGLLLFWLVFIFGIWQLAMRYDRATKKLEAKARENMNKEMTFRDLQESQRPWVAHNFPDRPSHIPLLGATEELGELAHAHIKEEQGIRGTALEHQEAGKDAVGDTIIYLSDYCSARGWDLQEIMEEVWGRVEKRDWKANPVDAAEVAEGD